MKMDKGKKYKLIFKQIKPLHIGWRKYGIFTSTRLFIPGWTMWGALLNAYVAEIKPEGEKKDKDEKYDKSKELYDKNKDLFSNITCFFPSLDNRIVNFPLIRGDKFKIAGEWEEDFRARYLSSFVLNSVSPTTQTTVEGALYELEVILPKLKFEFRKSEKKDGQLFWIGIIQVLKKEEISFLKERKGKTIFVGGEQKYGLGELLLYEIEEITDEDKYAEYFSFSGINNSQMINFVEYSEELSEKLDNQEIEILFEIDRDKKDSFYLKFKGCFYVPGCTLKNRGEGE